jgi:hypothetical protein
MNLSDLSNPDNPKNPKINKNSVLEQKQQEFLETIRCKVSEASISQLSNGRYLREQYVQLYDQKQRGSWDNFYKFIINLKPLRNMRSNETIILGGWRREFDLKSVASPPLTLLEDLRQLKIHAVMLKRIASDTVPKVIEWTQENRFVFERTLIESPVSSKIESLKTFSQKMSLQFSQKIHRELLFMMCSAFIFKPTEANPSAGWEDLFTFCLGYNVMPEKIKGEFQTHYLVIQKPTLKRTNL